MKRHRLLALLAVVTLCAGASLAGTPSVARPAGLTPDYRAEGDGPVFMAVDPAGRMWAVWAYAQGGEFDIAVSVSDGRVWTYPALLGAANGRNDLDPRIAFLANGTPVVVWWQEATATDAPRVMQSVARNGVFSAGTVVRVGARQPAILSTSSTSITLGLIDSGTGDVVTQQSPLTPTPISGGVWRDKPSPDGGTNGPDPMPNLIIKPPEAPIQN
jgi:hypothetical protein